VNALAVVFLILVVNQLVATATFIGIYGTQPGWRDTPVGRHMMFWSASAFVLDLSWVLLLVVKAPWLMYVLFAAQAAVGLVTWQRVWLAWTAQRQD
jgi:hypothetical protein